MDFVYFEKEVEAVIVEENPVLLLERLLKDHSFIKSTNLLQLSVYLERKWSEVKHHNVQVAMYIKKPTDAQTESRIYDLNFQTEIQGLLSGSSAKSLVYYISPDGAIIKKLLYKEKIKSREVMIATQMNSDIAFFLGVKGIDVWIQGVLYSTQNHIDSYKDLIKAKAIGIENYAELLRDFFDEYVQYDPRKRYFLHKGNCSKDWHKHIDQNPKLLDVKPEERFQIDLEQFLKERCSDPVLKEVRNRYGERYDIWVSTSDDADVYIFELKWLGKSITPSGLINRQYDKAERAIEGAEQIKNYIDNSEKTLEGLTQSRIHMGVLVIFDAREVMDDISYPPIYQSYPNIDLKQHFKVLSKKVSASKSYKHQKQINQKPPKGLSL
ncbi:hypothetical protein [Paenibacillus zanthoxyli]|uniref:hypothetical protein n=1 Tax=Paenibacillus zanthoxyli TaxID=369399 RepID=UPI0004702F71|nr:hypothetical protein [Paenibacillus zanthoxyli]